MKKRSICVWFLAGFCLFCFQSCCVLSNNGIYTLDSAKAVILSDKESPADEGRKTAVKTNRQQKLPRKTRPYM